MGGSSGRTSSGGITNDSGTIDADGTTSGGGVSGTGAVSGTGGLFGSGGILGSGGLLGTGGLFTTGGTSSGFDGCAGLLTTPEQIVVFIEDGGVTIAKTLPCEWQIPPAPFGSTLQRTSLNLLVSFDGESFQTIAHVSSSAACSGSGWYYNDEVAPGALDAGADATSDASTDAGSATRVIACPATCDALMAATNAAVQMMLGCPTVSAQ